MTRTVALVGLALMDRVFRVDALPATATKHFAAGYRESVGGIAANAARAVAALGGRARLVGRVGRDATGGAIRAALEAEGVNCAALEARDGATPHSAVCVDRAGERMIVNYKEPALFADGALAPGALDGADAVMCDLRWPSGAAAALEAARAAATPAVLDFDQAPESGAAELVARASHVVFGREALAALTGENDPERALAAVSGPAVAVTSGAEGVVWRLPGGRGGQIPAHRVRAVDTLGAGDVFHGAVALALAEGADFAAALAFANAVAALKVSRPGDAPLPTRKEVDQLLKETP